MDACQTLHQIQDLDTKCEFAILHTSTTWYCYKSLLLGDLTFLGFSKACAFKIKMFQTVVSFSPSYYFSLRAI